MQSPDTLEATATREVGPARADPRIATHIAEADAHFGRGWVCAGHVAMLTRPGDYFSLDLIGNLLVVARGADRIRVLSRVCLHRWASVVEGAGNARRFTCPFHAWSYSLDGRLIGAAFMDQVADFDSGRCRLPELRSEIDANGLIFTTLSEHAGDIPDVRGRLPASVGPRALAAGAVVEQTVPQEWKGVSESVLTGGRKVFTLMPNLTVFEEDGEAILQFLFPNGPAATIVRTLRLSSSA